MKFNVQLSSTDIKSQAKHLKSLYGQSKEHSSSIHKEIKGCLKIFQNTFKNETCPNCGIGELKSNHLSSMYNIGLAE